MNTPNSLGFDFDFDGTERSQFLDELNALYSELGDESQGQTPDNNPTSRLFAQLNQEIAKFAKYPDVDKLSKSDFTDSGRTVPHKFQELSQNYKFYWIHFPITLSLPPNWYFKKLECIVEFHSEFSEAHLQPKALMILPDRKFQQQLKTNSNIEICIGENLEFEATTGQINLQAEEAKVTTNIGANLNIKSNFGLTLEPFTYSLKTAQITHNNPGDSQVMWRIDGAEFFQDNHPTLIVVLQVPKSVQQVKIDAALQAYHHPNFWTAEIENLGDLMRIFSSKARTFFEKGAPIKYSETWNITPSI
ncbi:MAG: hypothetical protein RMY64_04850 [Nostoc sp. DedQUE08]|uniref:hypothetical protein n=1 Tax=unclassified Nostoc TaxID=2593658 RepID=UPI002AD296FF|nr:MULTISPECIES: hypothetical protein [unclassified Nostoc]MDZ8030069.1 hypothetical protein [Nostoc sp. DedSLP04]MDZ8064957.1 hypothetical protein [Nostoc sp. DedQUE08]